MSTQQSLKSDPKNQLKSLVLSLLIFGLAAIVSWPTIKGFLSPAGDLPFTPIHRREAILFGDTLISPTSLDNGEILAKLLTSKLNMPVRIHKPVFGNSVDAINDLPRLIEKKPSLVILSLGFGALSAKEDLGTTIGSLKNIAKGLQKEGIFVMHLGINPPLVGDNWAMALLHTCKELKILCIEDIFSGEYSSSSDPFATVFTNVSYEKAAERVKKAISPYLAPL